MPIMSQVLQFDSLPTDAGEVSADAIQQELEKSLADLEVAPNNPTHLPSLEQQQDLEERAGGAEPVEVEDSLPPMTEPPCQQEGSKAADDQATGPGNASSNASADANGKPEDSCTGEGKEAVPAMSRGMCKDCDGCIYNYIAIRRKYLNT